MLVNLAKGARLKGKMDGTSGSATDKDHDLVIVPLLSIFLQRMRVIQPFYYDPFAPVREICNILQKCGSNYMPTKRSRAIIARLEIRKTLNVVYVFSGVLRARKGSFVRIQLRCDVSDERRLPHSGVVDQLRDSFLQDG